MACQHCYSTYFVVPGFGDVNVNFVVVLSAVGTGDPHITTLDGKSFAFNAIGEYTLMKVTQPSLNFELQGRTCQATSSSGAPVLASIFCAFVAKGNNSDILQVELSRSENSRFKSDGFFFSHLCGRMWSSGKVLGW